MNRLPVDQWTPAHFAWGVLAAHLRVSPAAFALFSVVFEMAEKRAELNGFGPFKTKTPESRANVAADLAVGLLCYTVARRMRDEKQSR